MIPQHGTLEISRSRLLHNLALLQKSAGTAQLCATIKANAYGHGIHDLTPLLAFAKIVWVAAYTLQEAFEIASIQNNPFNILVLAPFVSPPDTLPLDSSLTQQLQEHHWNLRINLTDIESAQVLSRLVTIWGPRYKIKVHVQIDTGLTRLGVDPQRAAELCKQIGALPGLALEGLFSHLSHGDTPGHPTLQQQLHSFQETAAPNHAEISPPPPPPPKLRRHLPPPHRPPHQPRHGPYRHRPLRPPTLHRPPHPPPHNLQPIAQLTAPILAIHDRPAHTGVGYGHTFVTKRESRLAVVPVGYADGYPRQLSNTKNAIAQLRGIDVPVVGRVSMDQIILDITDVPATPPQGPVHPGETVTVISNNSAKPNSLDNMATAINTIGYELATHLGPRLKRVIVD